MTKLILALIVLALIAAAGLLAYAGRVDLQRRIKKWNGDARRFGYSGSKSLSRRLRFGALACAGVAVAAAYMRFAL